MVADAKNEVALQAADSKLATLKALLEIEALEDGGRKDSEEWKTAAKKLVELQRQAAVSDSRWKLSTGEAAVTKADAAIAKAKEDKKQVFEPQQEEEKQMTLDEWKKLQAKKVISVLCCGENHDSSRKTFEYC